MSARTESPGRKTGIDVLDDLTEIRREVDGIGLMAQGLGVDATIPEEVQPLVDAAVRVHYRLVEIRDAVSMLLHQVRS